METLIGLARSINAERIVEFGCQNGRTAKMFLDNVDTLQQYVGIDVLQGYLTEKLVQRNEVPDKPGEFALKDSRFKLLVKSRGSYDVTPSEIGFVDMAFVDGDHSAAGVANDTRLARTVVRKGGLIVWHDYHDLGTVDVKPMLEQYATEGHKLIHVENTWLVFEKVA